MITLNYLQNSFNRDGVSLDTTEKFIPHLVFDYVITSHQFNPTPYFNKQLSQSRIDTQKKVEELHNQGLGYTKIHHHLIKTKFYERRNQNEKEIISDNVLVSFCVLFPWFRRY